MDYLVSGYSSEKTSLAFLNRDGVLSGEQVQDAPSFVIAAGDLAFTVTEHTADAAIHLYKKENAALHLTDSAPIAGNYLCHLAYSELHRLLFGACYGNGLVFAAQVEDEKFGRIENYLQTDGKATTRAHSVLLNGKEDTLYSANIALDRIYVYAVSDAGLQEQTFWQLPKGKGSRHMALSQKEDLLYVITEYSNEVLVLDTQSGALVQEISTLPAEFTGTSHCSTLCFTPDFTKLYGANRFADTVALFAVQPDGRLCYQTVFSCEGKNPRHMQLAENGTKLIVCNQDSDAIVQLTLDTQSGLPTGEKVITPFAKPAGVFVL